MKWRATWIDQGSRIEEIVFEGPESRIAASVDFRLLLLDMGEKIPDSFELEDAERTRILPAITRRVG